MYKEAKEYDRAAQRGGGVTYRVGDKSQPNKQASNRKSPAHMVTSASTTAAVAAAKTAKPSRTCKSPVVTESVGAVVTARRAATTAAPPKASRATPEKAVTSSTEKLQTSRASQESVERTQTERVLRVAQTPPTTNATPLSTLLASQLPVAPSPVEDPDQEDKVSEAGTYTIEAEQEDAEEELKARQQIDEVFGVDLDSFSIERPVIGSMDNLNIATVGGGEEEDVLGKEEEEEGERTLHDDDVELEEDSVGRGCHTPCDEDGNEIFDEDDGEENEVGTGLFLHFYFLSLLLPPSFLSCSASHANIPSCFFHYPQSFCVFVFVGQSLFMSSLMSYCNGALHLLKL
jgi:hypothetical protein